MVFVALWRANDGLGGIFQVGGSLPKCSAFTEKEILKPALMAGMKNLSFAFLLALVLLSGCGRTKPAPADTTGTSGITQTTDGAESGEKTVPTTADKTAETAANIERATTKDIQSFDMSYLYPVRNNEEKWGYIDSDGKLIIDYIYEHAGFFTDGLAPVRQNGMEGFIGTDGKYVVEPEFEYCGNYSEGWARVIRNKVDNYIHGFINIEGETIFKDYFNNNTGDFHDGLAVFEKDYLFGYVNTSGDIAIQPGYFLAYDFSEGLATVANDEGKCGFINKSGELVIPFQFDHSPDGTYLYEGFSNGLAAVCINDKFGFVNSAGEFVIDAVYDYAGRFSDGTALVVVDGLFGYINESGKYIIEPQFAHATSFHNGYAFVRKSAEDFEQNGGYALIDKKGALITGENLIYENGGGYTFISEWNTGFVEELARVVMEGNESPRFVYINKSGDVVWEMK